MSNSKNTFSEQKSSNVQPEAPNPQTELQESNENEELNTFLNIEKGSKDKLMQKIKT